MERNDLLFYSRFAFYTIGSIAFLFNVLGGISQC